MADNVNIDPGTTTSIATDDVSGVQFQKVKINLGGDGADGDLWDGKVQGGTINVGTVSVSAFSADIPGGTIDAVSALPDLPGGTIDSVTSVGSVVGVGTISNIAQVHNAGTIQVLPDLPGGTIDAVTSVTDVANVSKGTITRVEQGSIQITAGTVNATIGDIVGGTIDLITAVSLADVVGNVAHDAADSGDPIKVGGKAGTTTPAAVAHNDRVDAYFDTTGHQHVKVDALSDLPGGTVDVVTSVANLAAGTVTSVEALPDLPGGTVDLVTSVTTVGTVTGAGTVANIGVIHNAGTIAGLPDLPGGTVDLVTAVSNVTNLDAGTVTRLEQGSIQVTAGTISAFTADIPGGTIDSITNIAGGTVQLNPKPTSNIITYGTSVGGTAATGVTLLSAPGAGTSIYLNEVSVVNRSTATAQVHIGFGTASTQGTSQVLSGIYAGNGGIQKTYPKAVGGHITNLALLGSITAAGTVDVHLSYWVE